MHHRSRLRALAVVVGAGTLAAACTGRSHTPRATTTVPTRPTAAPATGIGSVTVSPVSVSNDAAGRAVGVSSPLTVRIGPSPDRKLRVAFTEDAVAGTGAQWEAAGWSAVTVATMFVGAPLTNREVDFSVGGRIDGPSAGALMAVATIAVMRGDPILPDVTMTGTINPDGTIGPVAAVPYEVQGAIAAHKQRMLIPTGQSTSPNNSHQLVDVEKEGARQGVTVTEVGNIYDAYRAMTGKDLPRATAATNVAVDAATAHRLAALVSAWGSRYATATADFELLAPTIRSDLAGVARMADSFHAEAKQLGGAGLQAGAFQKSVEAAAFAKAADDTGRNLPILLTQGVPAFVARTKSSAPITAAVTGLVADLAKFTPASVSDAGALIAAYGDAVDAVSFSHLGQKLLDAHAANAEQGATLVTEGAVSNDLAGTLVEAASDVFGVSRDLGGAKVRSGVDLAPLAQLLVQTAKANLNAFDAMVIEPAARRAHVSVEAEKARFAGIDSAYPLAVTGLGVTAALPTYFGNAATSEYAQIGGAVNAYNRTAGLLAKYSSLGQIDPKTLELTGLPDQTFSAAIALSQYQLAGAVATLQSNGVNPAIAVADNEVAGIDREGDTSARLDALNEYWAGYLDSRVLAYLGGFARL